MPYSYNLTTGVGQVRLTIGDTDIPNGANFTDEELTFMLMQAKGNVNLASVAALENWARKLSTMPKVYIGDYQEDPSNTAKNLLLAAQKLRQQIGAEDDDPVVMTGLGTAYYNEDILCYPPDC